jgi:hypothetical protein
MRDVHELRKQNAKPAEWISDTLTQDNKPSQAMKWDTEVSLIDSPCVSAKPREVGDATDN